MTNIIRACPYVAGIDSVGYAKFKSLSYRTYRQANRKNRPIECKHRHS